MVFFALGLMAKPMLVTLPLVLLLLDYWPLGRMASAASEDTPARQRQHGRAVFRFRCVWSSRSSRCLLLAAVSCVVTVWAQGEAMAAIEHFPCGGGSPTPWFPTLPTWVSSSIRWDWPSLSPPGARSAALEGRRRLTGVGGHLRSGAGLAAAVSVFARGLAVVLGDAGAGDRAGAGRDCRRWPTASRTCRRSGCALPWRGERRTLCRSWPYRRWVCGVASALVLVVLMGCAWRQTSFWRDSETFGPTPWLALRQQCGPQQFGLVVGDCLRQPRCETAPRQSQHAQRANQLSGGRQPDVLDTLAAAYAEAGRFPEALATARKALDLATQQHGQPLADVLRSRIALYEAGKPYRQTAAASTAACRNLDLQRLAALTACPAVFLAFCTQNRKSPNSSTPVAS